VYIELHAASAFSFLQGASLPETLVERAAALGYPAIALLDADGVYGAPRFHKAAKQAGLKAIIGAELSIKSQIPNSKSQAPPGSELGFLGNWGLGFGFWGLR
jgi:error-prone DNA polymerase